MTTTTPTNTAPGRRQRPRSPALPPSPTAPTLVSSNKQLTASWTAPTDTGGSAITKWEVSYKRDIWTNWNKRETTNTSYTITGLINDKTYQVRVRAKNTQGWSVYSDVVSDKPGKPAAVSAVRASRALLRQNSTTVAGVSLSWREASNWGPTTHYQYQYRKLGTTTWSTTTEISRTPGSSRKGLSFAPTPVAVQHHRL